ncbi:MAG: PD-(D/E)XK nuclease family protein [Bacteriovoracia bacterium]
MDFLPKDILEDAPLFENTRIVVGPEISRESVKNWLLEKDFTSGFVPGNLVAPLSVIAKDILKTNGIFFEPCLSRNDQRDALGLLSKNSKSKGREFSSYWLKYLKNRSVCNKVALFLSKFDQYYSDSQQRDALIEFYASQNPPMGEFLTLICQLWEQRVFYPWSDAEAIRLLISKCGESNRDVLLPKKMFVMGYLNPTPLERELLGIFKEKGVLLEQNQIQIQNRPLVSQRWQAHSVWDEIWFLKDWLDSNVNEYPVSVYCTKEIQPILRTFLKDRNISFEDSDFKEVDDTSEFWKLALRVVSSAFSKDKLEQFLVLEDEKLISFLRSLDTRKGTKAWRNSSGPSNLEIEFLKNGSKLLAGSFEPNAFSKRLSRWAREQDFCDPEKIYEFSDHLVQREYLKGQKFKTPFYGLLFEEHLHEKTKTLRTLNPKIIIQTYGRLHLDANVGIPRIAICLGTNHIEEKELSSDPYDVDQFASTLSAAWNQMHAEQSRKDLIELSLSVYRELIVSSSRFGLDGENKPNSNLFNVAIDSPITFSGGHLNAGWLQICSEKGEKPAVRLNNQLDQERVRISVRAFEDFLKCPFLYFARHQLKIHPVEELSVDVNKKQLGTSLHSILEKILVGEKNGELTLKLSRETIGTFIEQELLYLPLGIAAKRLLRTHLFERIVNWQDWEVENRKKHPNLVPSLFEKKIEWDSKKGLILSGKVDRVDICGDQFVVIDYKTSSSKDPIGKELLSGQGAQLVVYAKAIQEKIGLNPGALFYLKVLKKTKIGGGIFLASSQGKLHTTNARNSGYLKVGFDEVFERIQSSWEEPIGRLIKGDFSPKPIKEELCERCAYKEVCGYNE